MFGYHFFRLGRSHKPNSVDDFVNRVKRRGIREVQIVVSSDTRFLPRLTAASSDRGLLPQRELQCYTDITGRGGLRCHIERDHEIVTIGEDYANTRMRLEYGVLREAESLMKQLEAEGLYPQASTKGFLKDGTNMGRNGVSDLRSHYPERLLAKGDLPACSLQEPAYS